MTCRILYFVVWLLLLPTTNGTSQIRLTQEPLEVVLQQDAFLWLTQVPVEVLLAQDPAMRLTLIAVEVVVPDVPTVETPGRRVAPQFISK